MYRIAKMSPSVTRSMPMLKKSNKKTRVRNKAEVRWSEGLVLHLERRARKFHGRISRHRDRLPEPRPHLSPELYIISRCGDAQEKVGREMSVLRHAIVAAEEIPGHVELAKLEVLGADSRACS